MTHFLPSSRLPNVGTTIFTVMSRLAAEHGAINLSQGFPDFSPSPHLLERVSHHMAAGANQYPPMAGVPPLREAIAEKVAAAVPRQLRPGKRSHRHGRGDPGDLHRHRRLRAAR
jgi:methionine aminotransferase